MQKHLSTMIYEVRNKDRAIGIQHIVLMKLLKYIMLYHNILTRYIHRKKAKELVHSGVHNWNHV